MSYEGDGMTTMTNLNRERDDLLVNSYGQVGFRLNNGVFFCGPIVLFRRSVFQWDVPSLAKLNQDAFSLFRLLEPKVDLLIIGIGDEDARPPPAISQFLHQQKIRFEILTTRHACSTYNFLAAENRHVAAALLPPIKLPHTFHHRLENINKIGAMNEWNLIPDDPYGEKYEELFGKPSSLQQLQESSQKKQSLIGQTIPVNNVNIQADLVEKHVKSEELSENSANKDEKKKNQKKKKTDENKKKLK